MIFFLLLLNFTALNATVTQWFVHKHDEVTVVSWYCDTDHIPRILKDNGQIRVYIDQPATTTPKKLGPCTLESDDTSVRLILPVDYWYMLSRGTAVQEKECGILVLSKRRAPKLYGIHAVRIDAGHGGQDAGAVYGKVAEKDVTLTIAKQLAKICTEKKLPNTLTRAKDVTTALDARTNDAAHDQIFVSIHCNVASKPTTSGVEILYPAWSKLQPIASTMPVAWRRHFAQLERHSKNLAEGILSALTTAPVQGYMLQRRAKIPAISQVLCGSCTTAILIEAGFLTNDQERDWLANSGVHHEIAKRIAATIHKNGPLLQ